MTEYKYTKSITSDFGDNFNSTDLKKEIEKSNIGANIIRIDRLGDSVDIIVDASINESTLNTVITGHTSAQGARFSNTINNILRKNEIKDTTYKRACAFVYEGSEFIGNIVKINIIGYKDDGVTSYSVLVEDNTNNMVISETTFTNDEEEVLSLTPISNIPTGRAKIEVFIKKTGGKSNDKAHVETVTFYIG